MFKLEGIIYTYQPENTKPKAPLMAAEHSTEFWVKTCWSASSFKKQTSGHEKYEAQCDVLFLQFIIITKLENGDIDSSINSEVLSSFSDSTRHCSRSSFIKAGVAGHLNWTRISKYYYLQQAEMN